MAPSAEVVTTKRPKPDRAQSKARHSGDDPHPTSRFAANCSTAQFFNGEGRGALMLAGMFRGTGFTGHQGIRNAPESAQSGVDPRLPGKRFEIWP